MASFEEGTKGSNILGKPAVFVILADKPHELDEDSITVRTAVADNSRLERKYVAYAPTSAKGRKQ